MKELRDNYKRLEAEYRACLNANSYLKWVLSKLGTPKQKPWVRKSGTR